MTISQAEFDKCATLWREIMVRGPEPDDIEVINFCAARINQYLAEQPDMLRDPQIFVGVARA